MPGLHWLESRRGLDRGLRWVESITVLFAVAILFGGLLLLWWVQTRFGGDPAVSSEIQRLSHLLLLGSLAAPLIIPIVFSVTLTLRARLAADGKRLHARLSDGRLLLLDPTEVMHTEFSLFYRQHSLPLRTRGRPGFYREGEVETWVVPLLREENRLSRWQSLRHQWRYRDRALMWPLASVAGLTLVLALVVLLEQRQVAFS